MYDPSQASLCLLGAKSIQPKVSVCWKARRWSTGKATVISEERTDVRLLLHDSLRGAPSAAAFHHDQKRPEKGVWRDSQCEPVPGTVWSQSVGMGRHICSRSVHRQHISTVVQIFLVLGGLLGFLTKGSLPSLSALTLPMAVCGTSVPCRNN